ncbi:MAG TPA: arylsulfotransferase family protein [Solirubrobacteraceae bacterium]
MSGLRGGIAPLATIALMVTLGACGSAGTTGLALLDADASVSAAAANPVAVSPLPGTADASASTQISFLGTRGTRVARVRVVGSQTGVHAGVLRGYSTDTGESFLPTHPFAPGERVTVSARVLSGGHTRTARTNFLIAHQAPISLKPFPLNPGDSKAVQHYASAPALTPSTVTVTTPARPGASPGYLLLAPYQGLGTPGPMIADQSGRLVWFHPLRPGEVATNLEVQSYEGRPALTWWQGRVLELGFGQGEDVIYDSSYHQLAAVRAGNGYQADLHSSHLTPQGTAWMDVFDPIQMNLSRVGGNANGVLSDSIVQEVDVKTGLVMWEWHALGHIPLADSKNPVPRSSYPWDFVHINSVDPGSAGDVLLSFRNTWSLEDVDIHSGGVHWRLGGQHSTFRLGAGVQFYWQHDAKFEPGGLISLFDNGSNPPLEKQSRGLLLAPDLHRRSVRLVRQFVNPSRTLLASSQGNALALPGGNWLLGYGGLPDFTEFDGSGHVLLDGTLGRNVQSFRVTLSPWSGRAPGVPAIVASAPAGGGVQVRVSWNGATDVASWRLLAGASAATLAPAATVARGGFETTLSAAAAGPYVAVQALDAAGAVIGTSATVQA